MFPVFLEVVTSCHPTKRVDHTCHVATCRRDKLEAIELGRRQATKDAGTIAGLQILCIIVLSMTRQPLIVYGLDKKSKSETHTKNPQDWSFWYKWWLTAVCTLTLNMYVPHPQKLYFIIMRVPSSSSLTVC